MCLERVDIGSVGRVVFILSLLLLGIIFKFVYFFSSFLLSASTSLDYRGMLGREMVVKQPYLWMVMSVPEINTPPVPFGVVKTRVVASVVPVVNVEVGARGTKKKVNNSLNSSVFQPEVVGENIQDRYARCRFNSFATVAQCVQESTHETYKTGWKRWSAFCNWFQCDPYLRVTPVEWVIPVGEVPVNFNQMAVVSFMQKLSIDENLCPGTVSVYMSGVRHYFRLADLDLTFLESTWVVMARTAITLIFRKNNPIADRKGLPFTCDMIMHAQRKTFNIDTPMNNCILLAMKMVCTALMRVSEYLPGSPGVAHWMRSEDVLFRFKDGTVQPSWNVSGRREDLVSASLNVRSAKNDMEGEGHRLEFPKINVDSLHAFDIVGDLYDWAVRAQPRQGQPFLSYRGEWVLSYKTLSQAIKLVAKEMGLVPARFRTHSLRIGGATMMAAAGRPDYEIQKVGRWKSLAFLEYIRIGRATFKSALDAICNPVGFTIDDIRCLNSGG